MNNSVRKLILGFSVFFLIISCSEKENFRTLTIPSQITTEPQIVKGCNDPLATNFSAVVTHNDGSCLYIEGCLYDAKGVTNFHTEAVKENGECNFRYCKNPIYKEYNENYYQEIIAPYTAELDNKGITYKGTIDDSFCSTIRGCTEPKAKRSGSGAYNPQANEEDGSCQFKGCLLIDESLKTAYNNYKRTHNSNAPIEDTCNNFRGCLEPLASNTKDPAVIKIPDASCIFNGCNVPGTDTYNIYQAYLNYKTQFPATAPFNNMCDGFKGCLAEGADNKSTDPKIVIPDGSCTFRGCAVTNPAKKAQYDAYKQAFPGATAFVDTCVYGCKNQYADVQTPGAEVENGSCNFTWCSLPDYENTNDLMQGRVDAYFESIGGESNHTGTINKEVCNNKIGCMKSKAENFDSAAVLESGFCEFKGCLLFDPVLDQQYTDYIGMYPLAKLEDTCPGERSEVFTQNTQPHIGILWVIDNSGSMQDEQDALAANFSSFIDQFLNNNVKFTMGITTTDSKHIVKGQQYRDQNGNLRTYQVNSWDVLNSTEALKPGQDSLLQFKNAFKSLIKVGIYGDGNSEAGLLGGKNFLNTYGNHILPNADSFLAVIYVSDEDEHSTSPASDYVNHLRNKVAQASMVQAHAIVDRDNSDHRSDNSDGGVKYVQTVNSIGGTWADIDNNFGTSLANIGNSIINLLDLFTLNTTPYIPSIEVFVNEVKVNNWTYDANKNAIIFNNPPGFDTEVTVKYTPLQ